jgi:NAD-dependent dihydropyrimidine dehydrogenase PreA subunit
MPYLIGEPCIDIKDRSCMEECPVECIYEGERMLYIHPDECIDCGACEPACPMGAIVQVTAELDESWAFHRNVTRRMFDELGHLGGSYRVAETLADPAEIRAIPKRPE